MKTDFKPAKMVNWFHPSVLAQSGIKSVVSKMFGNYADRRETQAALDDPEAEDAWEKQTCKYLEEKEIWVDFISDTGDGFNATYSVATIAAQDELSFICKGKTYALPRAKILVLGGDQIYPTPTSELYHTNFRIPFESALPARDNDPGHPDMYAIPGNHDWYDGLGNFMKVFCQQRWIGNWKTHQLRSYFAIPLPNNYWLWATDIQLNEDIDKPQQDYFRKIARDKMKQDDKVILCTAEPSWVYKEMYPADSSYDRLQFFIDTYITKEGTICPDKSFRLAAVLTGDLHHYTHYCLPEEATESTAAEGPAKFSYHYIGAGGGGAFLHLTHNLPKKLSKLNNRPVEMKASFPNDKQSRGLLTGNFAFAKHNFKFSFLIGCVYLLFFWLMCSHFNTDPMSQLSLTAYIRGMDFNSYCLFMGLELVKNPAVLLLSVLIIWGFTVFADTKTGRKYICWWGFLHGSLQFLSIFLLLYIFVQLIPPIPCFAGFWFDPAVAAALLSGGTLTGGSLMGSYLLLSDLIFRIHIDESSSSLICEDYKNFLRMHISEDALTIYPIGIKKVTKKWCIISDEKDKQYNITGKQPAYHLIEEPIVIKLR
ncbi:Calcineurin-like phosphoesterase [Pedobacter westerhofensis]|uniref:Calcineurin-like phosphoesterase n=1 Tax=Pedobacter westerhofensis TaxID=425512 RepID=A0A521CTV4_9SPHI|nr:metallophosphoesterase [Pedobacter westerhofensis]SMO62832.1 Calcineurin-like phosphoesterase [Pedobacter westerhofensis]